MKAEPNKPDNSLQTIATMVLNPFPSKGFPFDE